MKRVFFVFGLVLFISLVSADVISINVGGSGNMIVNTNEFIDGFFSCVPDTCAGLGYSCGSWSDGCGLTINCGTCASGYTCSSGVCTSTSGSGGSTGTYTSTSNLVFDPAEINMKIAVNTNRNKILKITNNGDYSKTIYISQKGLDDMIVIPETSLTLTAGETKELDLTFIAFNETGIFSGELIIGGQKVFVTLNVQTKLVLFDSNVVVLNKNYLIQKGEMLQTQIQLIPMGDPERLDVTLEYSIQDYNNKTYLTKTETVLVEEETIFERDFDIGMLPFGDYFVGVDLTYENGVAPSSAHFSVVPVTEASFGNFIFVILLAILFVAITIISLLIVFVVRKNKS